MSKLESTHVPVADNCAWCSRAIDAPDDAWRRMGNVETLSLVANYCPPTKAERLDPSAGGTSKCFRLGQRNPESVAARLAAWREQDAEPSDDEHGAQDAPGVASA